MAYVLRRVREADGPVQIADLYDGGYGDSAVRMAASTLAADGSIVRLRRGVYAPPPSDSVTYPLLTTGLGASPVGRVAEADGEPQHVRLPNALVRQMTGGSVPEDGYFTFAHGPSMLPYIPHGCPIFVVPTDRFIDGERYSVWLGEDDADVVKRLRVRGRGALTLVADNPAVEDRPLDPTDDPEVWREPDGSTVRCVIRGRVAWVFSPVDPAAATGPLLSFASHLIQQLRP